MSDLPESLQRWRAQAVGADPNASQAMQAAQRPRHRPMPRQMRQQPGPSWEQRHYGAQQGDVSQRHEQQIEDARYNWTYGNAGQRVAAMPRLALESTGLMSVPYAAAAFQNRDWQSAGPETLNAGMALVPELAGLRAGARGLRQPPIRVREPMGPPAPRTVYHGSPHTFDSFDAGRIGTGEGAQAYGHGLYFAEHPDVAQSYADALTNPGTDDIARALADGGHGEVADDVANSVSTFWSRFRGNDDFPTVVRAAREMAGDVTPAQRAAYDFLESRQTPPGGGNLYEAQIPPNGFIDLDTPVAKQPPEVQRFMSDLYGLSPTEMRRRGLKPVIIGPAEAERARQAGFRGLQYLDQGSRVSGKGSRNFVVFDPNHVRPVSRNGEPLRRAPQAEPPPAPIRPPPREIGAGGLPVRQSEPFRNSLRGGSEDLLEAAAPRAGSDAGGAQGGQQPSISFANGNINWGWSDGAPENLSPGALRSVIKGVGERVSAHILAEQAPIYRMRGRGRALQSMYRRMLEQADIPPNYRAVIEPEGREIVLLRNDAPEHVVYQANVDNYLPFQRLPAGGAGQGGPSLRGFHGSPVAGLTDLRPGERGPMGPATYLSPNNGVAGRYGENIYEADAPNIFHGLGSSGFADSSINPYEIWRQQTARLLDAVEPAKRAELASIIERMHPQDGYPFFRRVVNLMGSEEAAQGLFKRAGFNGVSGHVDGPEIAIFGNVSPRSNGPAAGSGGAGQVLDDGARRTLRNLLREDGLELPSSIPRLPETEVPVSTLQGGPLGSLDRADARSYANRTTKAPPILVRNQGNGRWWVIDGNRRAEAARMRGDENIRVVDATRLFSPPSEPLASSAGLFPVPQVVQRDLQRLGSAIKGPRAPMPRTAYQGPGGKLAALSQSSSLPFHEGPRFLGQLPRRANNAPVDPKAVWAGAGLLSVPTGAATAGLVTQSAEENAATERMARLNAENRERLAAYQRGPKLPYQNPGRPAWEDRRIYTMPGDLEQPNEGYAINPATGRPLPAPKYYRRKSAPNRGPGR